MGKIVIHARESSIHGHIMPSYDRLRYRVISWEKWKGELELTERENYKKPVNALPYIGATGRIEYK